jgi:cytochrome c oxidase subunit 2
MHALSVRLLSLLCPGCSHWQSALQPGGPGAASIDSLLWIFTVICGAIWILVMLVLLSALRRRQGPHLSPLDRDERRERRSAIVVGAAVGATVLIIGGLTFLSYDTTRGMSANGTEDLVVRVRGYQWWWQVTYPNQDPARSFVTANEIHSPAGRPVRVELSSGDVIHSFWVPNLVGKQDLIPGRANQLTLTADHPGIYRGQCAQFCGLQHAHMAIVVVAETPANFEAWRERQIEEAATPETAEQERGRQFVTSHACVACHTVRGTAAAGTLGPDLTHLGSRQYIAAGLLPVTRGSLAAWIADPQTIKPGSNMPDVSMTADELNSVSAYLAALQ